MQLLGQHPQGLLQLPVAHPSLKTAMAGLVRRILPRQLPPLRPGAQNPQHPVQHRAPVLGRTPAPIRPSLKLQQRFQYRPLLVGDFSASSHRQFGRSSELPILSRYSALNTTEIFAPLFMRLVLLHHRLARRRTNVPQPKNRSPIWNHGNQIRLRCVLVDQVRFSVDGQTGSGDPWGVGQT